MTIKPYPSLRAGGVPECKELVAICYCEVGASSTTAVADFGCSGGGGVACGIFGFKHLLHLRGFPPRLSAVPRGTQCRLRLRIFNPHPAYPQQPPYDCSASGFWSAAAWANLCI